MSKTELVEIIATGGNVDGMENEREKNECRKDE